MMCKFWRPWGNYVVPGPEPRIHLRTVIDCRKEGNNVLILWLFIPSSWRIALISSGVYAALRKSITGKRHDHHPLLKSYMYSTPLSLTCIYFICLLNAYKVSRPCKRLLSATEQPAETFSYVFNPSLSRVFGIKFVNCRIIISGENKRDVSSS